MQEARDIESRYATVCGQLNMDQGSMDEAWSSYQSIHDNYTLEGDHLEWLACALYVAGQSSSLETVEGQTLNGNSVSLTQILRETKLNLIEFFKKMKKWIEMDDQLPQKFQEKIEALERKFEVASIIYDKYRKVFQDLFQMSEDRPVASNTRQRNRKSRGSRPCSAYEVFRFGWTLFVHIKSQYPQINDDLVNSHHLLLCCVDMLFSTSLMTRRRDLLDPDCPFLPVDFDLEYTPPLEMPSVLGDLCTKYNGIDRDCRVIRDFYWKPPIEKLFESKVLHSGPPTVTHPDIPYLQMFTPGNFLNNEKSLNREYEMNVLAQGDFDERVFLHPSASEEIGTPVGGVNFRTSLAAHTPPQHVRFGTPLLGREMLGSHDHNLTPASEATHSVAQLYNLLESCLPEPSVPLKKMCNSCMSNPLPNIEARVDRLSSTFLDNSPEEPELPSGMFGRRRKLQLSLSLYYKLLEAIMKDEEKKNADYGALQVILEYSLFHTSLFSLSVEIVLCSYNSQSRTFPWVLEVFNISAYHFYKLIEVAIKQERDFPRAIVKHLNKIEEMVLSSLAWRSDSPLFDAIEAGGPVPAYQDVALPTPTGVGARTPSLMHPRLRSLSGAKTESPLSSLQERLCSPGSTARRQLFSPPGEGGATPRSLVPIAPKPCQSGRPVTVTPLNMNSLLNREIKRQIQKIIKSPQKDSSVLLSPHAVKSLIQSDTVSSSPQHDASCTPMGSTSTSTTPSNTPSVSVNVLSSPPKDPISIDTAAELVSSTNVSPSRVAVGSQLSPPSHTHPDVPIASPIPSITITPLQSPYNSLATTPQNHPGLTSPMLGTPVSAAKPKKTGSLALFYRKMYQLAFIRIKDLCERLGLEIEFVHKVWTCFEYCMKKSEDLMRDRHLDQIIMCSIYILAKALRIDGVSFQEIMKQYRLQPQAKSHVYRSVLLNTGRRARPQPDTSFSDPTNTATVTLSVTSLPLERCLNRTPVDQVLYNDDIAVGSRGDIIQFYNTIYIGFSKDFVLKFSPTDSETSKPSLSPLPVIRKPPTSPRKISKHHNIYVSPHKSSHVQLSPLAKTYVTQKSPATDLQEINRSIRTGTKRILDLHASPQIPSPAKRPHLAPTVGAHKTHSLMQAATIVANDRAKSATNTEMNHS